MLGLMGAFTLAITPTGHQLTDEIIELTKPAYRPVATAIPQRPQLLVVTGNRDDPYTAAVVVNPHGYRVVVAETAEAAQGILQADADRIGVVLVDKQVAQADRVLGLARTLAPSAKLIQLPRNHQGTDVCALLRDAI